MPRHKQVPTLQRLSLRGVGSLVVAMVSHVVSMVQEDCDLHNMAARLQACIDFLSRLLTSFVPYHLFDDAAVEILESVKALIERAERQRTYSPHTCKSSYLTETNVVESLMKVVLNSELKQIKFFKWSPSMQDILFKNLEKTTELERLSCGWCTADCYIRYNKNIIDGISNMKNLRYFCCSLHCNDAVIEAIGENCPHIQCIDVAGSRAVTDRSVPFLLKCTKLVELHRSGTSVTTLGLAELLAGLPNLQDIGSCKEFGHVLRHLHESFANNRPFGLRKIQTRDLSTEDLQLLVDMFPKIEFVSLSPSKQISDLTVLISLNNLKDLELLSCDFYGDYFKRLIAVRGNNITKLHFADVEEEDGNALVDISQFCPKLKSLVFYRCEFTGNTNVSLNHITVRPFLNLEQITWMHSSKLDHLQFILEHALNIRSIELGASTAITHQTIVNILAVNPMKYLEEFKEYSPDMNMGTVELLLANCSNLKVLLDFCRWYEISMEELQTFKEYIKSNNFDLDIIHVPTYLKKSEYFCI